MGKCHFNSRWLTEKDASGGIISVWAAKLDEENILCKACDLKISVNRGFQSILQHSRGKKHKKLFHTKFFHNQLHLEIRSSQNINKNKNDIVTEFGNGKTPVSIQLYSPRQGAIRAELIWTMRAVIYNYSFNSCDGIGETFRAMFPTGSASCAEFTLCSTKMRYLVTEALGPFFQEKLLDDIQGVYFTLCYDETTNEAGEKEFQTQVRYWSKHEDCIVSKHLNISYMRHATAEDLFREINAALSSLNLPKQKLLMLGSDGPNVNKKVARLVNEDVLLLRQIGLVDIGVCNIHVIHNAFLKGLDFLGSNIADLLIAVKYFFKDKPSRWDDYQTIQAELGLPNHRFIKHINTRWLTLAVAAVRLVEQWPGVIKYFLNFIPKKCAAIEKTSTYKSIYNILKMPYIKAELMFVISSAGLFTKFTGTFQKNEPLIHVLYSEMILLLSTLILRFSKAGANEILQKNDTNTDLYTLFSQSNNLLDLKEINVGVDVKNELKNHSEKEQLIFLHKAQKHYLACCEHILQKTPINSKSLLKNFRCLQPKLIPHRNSLSDIIKIAKALPVNCAIDLIADEWKLLSIDTNISKIDIDVRIDHFWKKIFSINRDTNEAKYPNLTIVVKAALSLSHGNADVERGFSRSGRVLTKDRASMSEKMLNALIFVKDGLKFYNDKPEMVPIDTKLITLAQSAHHKYKTVCEQKAKEKEANRLRQINEDNEIRKNKESVEKVKKEKREIAEIEKQIAKDEQDRIIQSKTYHQIFDEANKKLKIAVSKKDLIQVNIAQSMLESANKIRMEEKEKLERVEKSKKKLDKRKATLLDNFIAKVAKST